MLANEYLRIRRYIKTLCLDNVKELCEKVGLDEFDTNLVVHTNKDYTRVYTSIELGICESAVSKKKHKALTKIRDYLKRNNIQY